MNKFLLSIIFLHFACTARNSALISDRNSTISEAGNIIANEFTFGLSQEELKLGTVKICRDNGIHKCATGFVISHEGHVLTANHVVDRYNPSDRKKVKDNLTLPMTRGTKVVSAFNGFKSTTSGEFIHAEPETFEVVHLKTFAKDRDVGFSTDTVDISLLKIKKTDLARFEEWTYPLVLSHSLPANDERIFYGGFPHVYYLPTKREEIETLAKENTLSESYSKLYRTFLPPSFNFGISTGLLAFADDFDFRSGDSYQYRVKTGHGEYPIETSAADAIPGNSGGPALRVNGEVFGIVTHASAFSRARGQKQNYPAHGSSGTSIKLAMEAFELRKLPLLETNPEKHKVERQKKLAAIFSKLDEKSVKTRLHSDLTYSAVTDGFLFSKKTNFVFETEKYLGFDASGGFSHVVSDKLFCETGGTYKRSNKYFSKIEFNFISNRKVEVRLLLNSYFSRGDKENTVNNINEWTPPYIIDPILLFTNLRNLPYTNKTRKGLELKGYSRYFLGTEREEFGFRDGANRPFMSSLAIDLLVGKKPIGATTENPLDLFLLNCAADDRPLFNFLEHRKNRTDTEDER